MNENLVLYKHIQQCLTLSGVAKKMGRNPNEDDLGVIADAAIVADAESNRILWIGKTGDLPSEYRSIVQVYDQNPGVWLPELVECHTHMIYGGERHHDYALRCKGTTYQEIATRGGGILSTIVSTRESSLSELLESAQSDLNRFQEYGVGVLEIKSGYGLSLESELKILKCIRALQEQTSVSLIPTFMPAHAIPPEFKGRADDYVSVICNEWIPTVAKEKLALFFDVFIETGFFSLSQGEKLLRAAKESGLGLKVHADQFTHLGGTELALEMGATSVDHLECVADETIHKLGQSKTVAVLLPGASLFMGVPYPPARKLIDSGARVALSTDYNPGTCPSRNLPLMTTLACSQMKMTVAEAITAVTFNAAAALGCEDRVGSLEVGKFFRVCQLSGESYEVLPYCYGELGNPTASPAVCS